MNDGLDHGSVAERLVQNICDAMFLRDFVVRNPKFTKSHGTQSKEAADVLVPFHNELLVFQVKSKLIDDLNPQNTDIKLQRIETTISDAIRQLKSITRAIKANRLAEVTNSWGIAVPFDCTKPWRLRGIVVLHLEFQQPLNSGDRICRSLQIGETAGMPFHVLTSEDLHAIASELDTLPDFLSYLKDKESLWRKGNLLPIACERDFLAVYKTNYETIKEHLDAKPQTKILAVVPGAWGQYQVACQEKIVSRNKRNNTSYFVDHIISRLRESIGYSLSENEPGTASQYFAIIGELSAFSRLHRRYLGDMMLQKMANADRDVPASCFAYEDPESRRAIVFVATSDPDRSKRMNALVNISQAVFAKRRPRVLIGIATDNLSSKRTSIDAVLIPEGAALEPDPFYDRIMNGLFKQPEAAWHQEWDQ